MVLLSRSFTLNLTFGSVGQHIIKLHPKSHCIPKNLQVLRTLCTLGQIFMESILGWDRLPLPVAYICSTQELLRNMSNKIVHFLVILSGLVTNPLPDQQSWKFNMSTVHSMRIHSNKLHWFNVQTKCNIHYLFTHNKDLILTLLNNSHCC